MAASTDSWTATDITTDHSVDPHGRVRPGPALRVVPPGMRGGRAPDARPGHPSRQVGLPELLRRLPFSGGSGSEGRGSTSLGLTLGFGTRGEVDRDRPPRPPGAG